MAKQIKFDTETSYPCRDTAKGLVVGFKSSTWLSGETLNKLQEKGSKIILKKKLDK